MMMMMVEKKRGLDGGEMVGVALLRCHVYVSGVVCCCFCEKCGF